MSGPGQIFQMQGRLRDWGRRLLSVTQQDPVDRAMYLDPEDLAAEDQRIAENRAYVQRAEDALPRSMSWNPMGRLTARTAARAWRGTKGLAQMLMAPDNPLESQAGGGAAGVTQAKVAAAHDAAVAAGVDPNDPVLRRARIVAHNVGVARHQAENIYTGSRDVFNPFTMVTDPARWAESAYNTGAEVTSSFNPERRQRLQELSRMPHSGEEARALIEALRPSHRLGEGERLTTRPVGTLRSMSPTVGEMGAAVALHRLGAPLLTAAAEETGLGTRALSAVEAMERARGVRGLVNRAAIGAGKFLPAQTLPDIVGGTTQYGVTPGEAAEESLAGNLGLGGVMEAGQGALGTAWRTGKNWLTTPGVPDVVDRQLARNATRGVGSLGPNLEPRPGIASTTVQGQTFRTPAERNWQRLVETEDRMAGRVSQPLEIEPPAPITAAATAAEQFPRLLDTALLPGRRAAGRVADLLAPAITPTTKRAAAMAGAGALTTQLLDEEDRTPGASLATGALILSATATPRQTAEVLRQLHTGQINLNRLTRPEMEQLWRMVSVGEETGLRPDERRAVGDALQGEASRRGRPPLGGGAPSNAPRRAAPADDVVARAAAARRASAPLGWTRQGALTAGGLEVTTPEEAIGRLEQADTRELVSMQATMRQEVDAGRLSEDAEDLLDEVDDELQRRVDDGQRLPNVEQARAYLARQRAELAAGAPPPSPRRRPGGAATLAAPERMDLGWDREGNLTHNGVPARAQTRGGMFRDLSDESVVELHRVMRQEADAGRLNAAENALLGDVNEELVGRLSGATDATPAAAAAPTGGTEPVWGWTDEGALTLNGHEVGLEVMRRATQEQRQALSTRMMESHLAGTLSDRAYDTMGEIDNEIAWHTERTPVPDDADAGAAAAAAAAAAPQPVGRFDLSSAMSERITVDRNVFSMNKARKNVAATIENLDLDPGSPEGQAKLRELDERVARVRATPDTPGRYDLLGELNEQRKALIAQPGSARAVRQREAVDQRIADLDRMTTQRTWRGGLWNELSPSAKRAFADYEALHPLPEGERSGFGAFDDPNRDAHHIVLNTGTGTGYAHMYVSGPVGGDVYVDLMAAHGGRGSMTMADWREAKRRIVERFGQHMMDQAPTWTHVGGLGQGGADEYMERIAEVWPRMRIHQQKIIAGLLAGGFITQAVHDQAMDELDAPEAMASAAAILMATRPGMGSKAVGAVEGIAGMGDRPLVGMGDQALLRERRLLRQAPGGDDRMLGRINGQPVPVRELAQHAAQGNAEARRQLIDLIRQPGAPAQAQEAVQDMLRRFDAGDASAANDVAQRVMEIAGNELGTGGRGSVSIAAPRAHPETGWGRGKRGATAAERLGLSEVSRTTSTKSLAQRILGGGHDVEAARAELMRRARLSYADEPVRGIRRLADLAHGGDTAAEEELVRRLAEKPIDIKHARKDAKAQRQIGHRKPGDRMREALGLDTPNPERDAAQAAERQGSQVRNGVAVGALGALGAGALLGQQNDGDGTMQAGLGGGGAAMAAMALAGRTPAKNLNRVLGGLAVAGAGYALSKGHLGSLADDPDIRATGNGAMALGLASAAWATGMPQRAWRGIGDEVVRHARNSKHGEDFSRSLIAGTNPEALLDPNVRRFIRQYEDQLGAANVEGERLGAVARNIGGQDVDRYISDLVEGEDWTGDPGRAALQEKYGEQWPAILKQAIGAAEAIRAQSGRWTDAKVKAGMLSPAAAEKYAVEGGSSYLPRRYAGHQALEANPAMERGSGAGSAMRVGEGAKRRSLDIPVDDARRELRAAQSELDDMTSRRADEPQPTPQEITDARRRVSEAETTVADAKAQQMQQRRDLGEIREASYRVPEAGRRAAREIAGAELYQNLVQLDEQLPDGKKLLHPEWRKSQEELIASRQAQAEATDVEAEANAADVRQHIETSLDQHRKTLASIDERIAQDTAAGKPVSARAKKKRRDVAMQIRQAEESLPYWQEMERSATNQSARQLADARVDKAKAGMEEVASRYRTKGESGWVTLGESGGFGPMKGAVVSQDLQPSLEYMKSPDRNPVTRFMRWWKRQKTVFSPGTHVGNTMSNVVMAHMAGLPVTRLPAYLKQALAAMREVEEAKSPALSQAGQTVQRLRGLGVMGSMAHAEGTGSLAADGSAMNRLLAIQPEAEPRVQDLLSQGHISEPQSWLERKVPKAAPAIRKGRALAEGVTRQYAREDDVFRVAMALFREAEGDAPEAAAEFARSQLIDYRSRSPALRNISQYGLSPFVLYPAKALPTFGKNLLEHPERWATLMAGMAGINEASQAQVGERNTIEPTDIPPEQRRELFGQDLGYAMPGMMQFPTLGSMTPMGRERIGFNPSRWFPTSNLVDRPPPELGYHGILPEWMPRALVPSGPLYEMPATFIANRDPYTGRPIVPPGASTVEWATKLGMRATRNLFSPVVGMGEQIAQNLTEGRGPGATAAEAVGQVAGLRPNTIQPGRYAQRAMNDLQDDERTRMGEARRAIATAYRLRGGKEREEARQAVMVQTREALARMREQQLNAMELKGRLRQEVEDAMLDAHERLLDNLDDYDPADEPRSTDAEDVLFEGIRRGRVRKGR